VAFITDLVRSFGSIIVCLLFSLIILVLVYQLERHQRNVKASIWKALETQFFLFGFPSIIIVAIPVALSEIKGKDLMMTVLTSISL
jgi:hypothetical protein